MPDDLNILPRCLQFPVPQNSNYVPSKQEKSSQPLWMLLRIPWHWRYTLPILFSVERISKRWKCQIFFAFVFFVACEGFDERAMRSLFLLSSLAGLFWISWPEPLRRRRNEITIPSTLFHVFYNIWFLPLLELSDTHSYLLLKRMWIMWALVRYAVRCGIREMEEEEIDDEPKKRALNANQTTSNNKNYITMKKKIWMNIETKSFACLNSSE